MREPGEGKERQIIGTQLDGPLGGRLAGTSETSVRDVEQEENW